MSKDDDPSASCLDEQKSDPLGVPLADPRGKCPDAWNDPSSVETFLSMTEVSPKHPVSQSPAPLTAQDDLKFKSKSRLWQGRNQNSIR
jgi:hypothetical protein